MSKAIETVIVWYLIWVWAATWGEKTLDWAYPIETIKGWFA